MKRAEAVFVVMAGGKGERLWPLVRVKVPKACVSVDGARSLLEATLQRLQPLASPRDLLIVTTQPQVRSIRRRLPPSFQRTVLIEPAPRNTAACIGLAAASLAEQDPTQVMVVLPADHWIHPVAAFHRSLHAAITTAQQSRQLVMIGIRPRRVHPGLGHLCVQERSTSRYGCRVFRLARFVEKPPRAIVQRLMRQGTTYWNAGIFVGQAGVFVEQMQRWLPGHAARLVPLARQINRPGFHRRAAVAYRALRAISFDHGVMAHVREGSVVEGRFAWEDLGSWDSWVRICRPTAPALAMGGKAVHVVSPNGHLVATVGLRDTIIVHTPDATLVCRTQDAQAVRDLVARLAMDRRLARYC